jgi:hypothetical protein
VLELCARVMRENFDYKVLTIVLLYPFFFFFFFFLDLAQGMY